MLLTAGAVGIGMGLQGPSEPPAPGRAQRGLVSTSPDSSAGTALARSVPVRLDVPAVRIHTKLIKLGLNPDRTLEVPSKPMLAGWYTGSPTPGQRGPSVLAGHVDSKETGPAVFYRLGQVKVGDRIEVTLQNGETAYFRAVAVRAYAKRDFPTQLIYGNTDRATLRLVTCGDWNDDTSEYDGNVVVFADAES